MRTIKRGFTLIELLIVITIVGILVAVATASYLTALKQSRDTRRKTDLEQIRQALETYRAENGLYPDASSSLSPDYITILPTDPKGGTTYQYVPSVPASSYSLCTTLEIIPSPAVVGCGDITYNYELNNP